MTGTLEILNCGHGDMKVTFDDKNPLELERAKRIIQDMIAHLTMMRGDEPKFWANSNQHDPNHPNSGI